MVDTMCGGFQRRGTDFACLYLSGFYDYARYHNKSYAVLFLDVSAAFESMQRFFVFGPKVSDHHIATVFAKCNFPQSVWPEFLHVKQCKAKQCKAKQCKAKQGKARPSKVMQSKTMQNEGLQRET